jgi:hypothetical protein
MMSANVPGIPGWGNVYYPSLLGAHGLSPCHGGGLRAPFLFRREVAGLADSTGQRDGTSPVFQHLSQHGVPVTSRFRGRPQLLTRCSPLPTGRGITSVHFVPNVFGDVERHTCHRIPTKMPFRAVFMRGRCRPACMDDLVVDQWTSAVESSSPLDFLSLHTMRTPFGCLISYRIMSILSVGCDFTTQSGGI